MRALGAAAGGLGEEREVINLAGRGIPLRELRFAEQLSQLASLVARIDVRCGERPGRLFKGETFFILKYASSQIYIGKKYE